MAQTIGHVFFELAEFKAPRLSVRTDMFHFYLYGYRDGFAGAGHEYQANH